MKNYVYVILALVAIFGGLNAISDNRDNGAMANTVAQPDSNVIVLDGNDPFFQSAGTLAVGGAVLLIALILIRGPHKNSHTTRQTAVIAAIVLCLCLFLVSYLSHSGQGDILTILLDGF